MKKRRFFSCILALALIFVLGACSGSAGKPQESETPAATPKVAVLLPGSINDGGWSTTGQEGRRDHRRGI